MEIAISVQYQVIPEGAYTAFYRLTDVHGQVSAYVFDVVRSTVPKIELDEVFLQKEEIAHKVMNSLREEMDDFGYAILDALVVDIDPNWKVKDSMNQINAAKRMREAAHFKADADKIRQVKAAEADAEAKYLSGKGVARQVRAERSDERPHTQPSHLLLTETSPPHYQRMAIVEGLRDSVVDFRKDVAGTTASEVMDILLLTQYFDLLKDVGAGTAFLNVGPEEVVNLKASLAKVIVKKRGGGVFPGVY